MSAPDPELESDAAPVGRRDLLGGLKRLWAVSARDGDEASPRSGWARVRRRLAQPRLWIIAAGVLALYAALGFLAAPPLIKGRLIEEIETRYGRQARIERVAVNPFTLTLDVRGLHMPDADGADAFSVALLRLNLSISSLWRGGLAFDQIRIEAPRVRLERRADGAVNLSDFAPPPSDDPAEPMRLWVRRFEVSDGRVDYADRARAQPFTKRLAPIAFTLTDFATAGEGNSFNLSASGDRGERIAWRGTFSLEPFASDGAFDLAALDLASLAEWAGEALPFAITSGALDASGTYAFNLAGAEPSVRANAGRAALRGMALRAAGEEADWVRLESGEAADVRLDLAARSVTIGNVALAAPYVFLAVERDGTLNLARLAPAPAQTMPAQTMPAQASGAAPLSAAEAPWRVSALHIQVVNGQAEIEERSQATPVRYALAGLALTVEGFALPAQAPAAIDLQTQVNSSGRLSARGAVALDPMSADLAVNAEAIDLSPLQPYLDAATGIRIVTGAASADGQATFSEARGLRFRGDARIEGVRTIDVAMRQDFLRWRSLAASGVDFRSEPFSLRVRRIALREPYARVVIGPDRSVNIAAALQPPSAPRAAAATPTVDVPPPPQQQQALPIEIGVVRIDSGSMNFADYSTRPNFEVALQQLAGDVRGLSGNASARADVALEGLVDRYAPATINGQVNYFAAQAYTDIAMNFRNIEMTTLTPYSGRFAGYEVRRGKLNVELRYRIENQRLNAEHHIVIDNLQLGERVESEEAVRLPVRLAVALLMDSNGVIDIDLPVSGSLDDPRFRMGPIIGRVIMNLLTRIITSPFALLGALVGGGEEMQFVDFAPGQAALDETARANLANMRRAMLERPGISLDVPLAFDPARDRAGIQAARVEAMAAEEMAERLGRRAEAPGAVEAALADPDERQEALERVYRRLYERRPEIPDRPAPADGEERIDETAHKIAWLEEQTRARIDVTDADLADLGRARAAAVQDALLEGAEIDPGRVFIIAQTEVVESDGPVRMRLDVTR